MYIKGEKECRGDKEREREREREWVFDEERKEGGTGQHKRF